MKKVFVCLLLAVCMALPAFSFAEDGLTVTATFYPVYVAALNIARGAQGVSVECLTPPGAGCLHDYQMTTADRRALSDSDIIVMNGAGLESFLDKLLPQLDAQVIDASAGIELLADCDDGHDHAGHDHGEMNPHVWVSVSGAMQQAENIAAGLAGADPANAELYRNNCAAYLAKLDALRAETAAALAPLAGMPVVTFHKAFDYYAAEFGLEIAAVVQHEEGDAPSAREIADVIAVIEEKGVRALFAEPQYADDSVDLIARETGLPVYILDPAVSGEADPEDFDAYLRIMRQNLETLVEALS